MYIVYVLYSKSKDRYYIGQTADLATRLSAHNFRKNLGASDWICVYRESYDTRSSAMQRESQIKRRKSRKYIEELVRGSSSELL